MVVFCTLAGALTFVLGIHFGEGLSTMLVVAGYGRWCIVDQPETKEKGEKRN
jgi:hypothetical protein